MKIWVNIFRGVILIIGVAAIGFDVLLYNSFEKQKMASDLINNQQQIEAKVNANKFKYEQEQMERLSKDLEDSNQKVKDQKDALLQEIQKRQQIENDSKMVQISLVDMKAQADAIKQDMMGWQKDYVSVLAQLEKKLDDSQDEIRSVKASLDTINIPELKNDIKSLKADIEKFTMPADNSVSDNPPVGDKK